MTSDHRSVVLITVDSLRADHCGCYGYGRSTTPTIDRMAEEGLLFENAVSPGTKTPESIPVIFTGEYPVLRSDEGMATWRSQIKHHMRKSQTIQERLSTLGYETAAFTPNPWTSRYFGFDEGFDHFVDFMDEDRSSGIWQQMLEGKGSKVLSVSRLLLSWFQRENAFKPWEAYYDDIIDWVKGASEPYFLWAFPLDVHFPYLPNDEHRTQSRFRTYEGNLRLYLESQTSEYSPRVHNELVTSYDDAIRYTDEFVKRLRADLPGDPVFIITSDHGEAFGEFGSYGHHTELYEPNIHVPLVVSGVEKDTISEPFTLKDVGKLILQAGKGEDIDNIGQTTVSSVASDGDKIAIRGELWKYMRDEDDASGYPLPETDNATDVEALKSIGHQLAEITAKDHEERMAITEAAERMNPVQEL